MDEKIIYGIQQIGVGCTDAEAGFKWYAQNLGADIEVFDDNNTATHMAPYMGGEAHDKRAIMAINLQGGSGYEIWQFLDRTPVKPSVPINIGDLGINIMNVKSRDINLSFNRLKIAGVDVLSDINTEPDGKKSFFIRDPFENVIRIKEFDSWYQDNGYDLGGNYGCTIGVSDIEKSFSLYKDALGYDKIEYDVTDIFGDLKALPNGTAKFRRVLLSHSETKKGGFASLFGKSQIELIQCMDASPKKIFEGRYWGDVGFIHLCFDIKNMKALVKEMDAKGFPFKVLSNEDFDMGDANGHWGYIEDPDGTLIEFVEAHKVPLLKKPGVSINMKKRNPHKPLPNWLIKAMALKRVKF